MVQEHASEIKVLVFGRSGQVARALKARAPQSWQLVCLGRNDADLNDPEGCARAIAAHGPDVVINAAAYTAVDAAESDAETALRVNAESPGAMARASARIGAVFLHISTDYVFDGSGDAPYPPDAAPGPLGVYGRTKLAGERAVTAAGGRHAILRTAWVFSDTGANFVRTMLRLGRTRGKLRVVADQWGGPTPASAIADALIVMARSMHATPACKSGIYHFSGAPHVSWAGFARAIFDVAGMVVEVEDITTADYPTPARRPANSRLDGATTAAAFGLHPPDWRAALHDIVPNLLAQEAAP